MANRIATEYRCMELDLDHHQFQMFTKLFESSQCRTEVRIYENSDPEFILFDEGNEKIPLTFKKVGAHFKYQGSYKIRNWKLAHAMQKAIRDFKGAALVHRIYDKQTIEYHYQNGIVQRIIEMKDNNRRLIYEYKDTLDKIKRLFTEQVVEDHIAWIKLQIDMLLDKRQQTKEKQEQENIDLQLKNLSKELFINEAI